MYIVVFRDSAGNSLMEVDVPKGSYFSRLMGKIGTWECSRKPETKENVLKEFADNVGISPKEVAKFLDEYSKAVS